MKILKNAIFSMVFLLPLVVHGQNSAEILPLEKYKHEIGVDIVSLTKLILDFRDEEFANPYAAVYQLTYKRHFNKFSLRFGIGGRIVSQKRDIEAFDREEFRNSSQNIRYRIGVEKHLPIGKRWNFYYGVDFRQDIRYSKSEYNKVNGLIIGRKTTDNSYGVAPLIGFEFKINNRIFLQTEASFLAQLSKSSIGFIYRKNPGSTTAIPEDEPLELSEFNSGFSVPNFLVLGIKL